jgi:DNA topoisomerase I
MPRLRRADCSGPGYTRRRRGRGWQYLDAGGTPITDAATLLRIKQLVIPPAWTDVWICPHPNGHLQAVGTDAAGRKQYLYCEEWRVRQDRQKFDAMLDFARALPALRGTCEQLLGEEASLGRERVLAAALRLLDRGFFRIGGEDYAEESETFGLATLRKDHVRLRAGTMSFDFTAKGGQRRVQQVVDPLLWPTIKLLKQRSGGGPELLAYKEGRLWVDVTSSDVNAFLKEVTGGDFSAKDFRTWHATVLAAVALAVSSEAAGSPSSRKRAKTRAVQEVSHYLGNTPAVCRKSYIDPRVFDRYDSRWTIAGVLTAAGEGAGFGDPAYQGEIEAAVLDLIEYKRSSPAVEKAS